MSGKFDMVNCDRYRAACEIGADFYKAIILKSECTGLVRDLSGYTSKMEVRAAPAGTVVLTPTMTIHGFEGKVEAAATAAVTAALAPGIYYYDWIITGLAPGFRVERILEGKFQITSRITT